MRSVSSAKETRLSASLLCWHPHGGVVVAFTARGECAVFDRRLEALPWRACKGDTVLPLTSVWASPSRVQRAVFDKSVCVWGGEDVSVMRGCMQGEHLAVAWADGQVAVLHVRHAALTCVWSAHPVCVHHGPL